MLLEPRIDRAALLAAVENLYGLEITAAEFIPVGWSSAAYTLDTSPTPHPPPRASAPHTSLRPDAPLPHSSPGQPQFFLKLWPGGRDAEAAVARLPLLQHLHTTGFRARVPYPLPTTDGQLSAKVPAGAIALFPYLAGTTPPDWPRWPSAVLTELGHTIADLHGITLSSGVRAFRERLSITIADDLRYHLADKAIQPFRSDVLDQLDRLYELQRAARRLHLQYVVSHTDLLGDNILVSGDRLGVLDWDGALLAPREFDLAMLLHCEQPTDPTALQHTLAVYPGVPLHRELFAFFLLRRYLEDFTARAVRLHDGGLMPEEAADARTGLHQWGAAQWIHLDETLAVVREELNQR